MKLYLVAIILLSLSQSAVADTTLAFKNLHNPGKQGSIFYQIKEQKLRFTESGSTRVNLFDKNAQQFTTFDPSTKKAEMFNRAALDTRVAQFNQKRLLKLSKVEQELKKKLKSMSKKEQEVGDAIVNQLKFPEFYGEHTLLSINSLEGRKQIGDVECQIFQLIKKKQRLKEYCLAKPSSLKMSHDDYQTLRSFYAFDYNMLARLMLAMGKSNFELIDYEKEKMHGVVIEVISYKGDSISQHQILTSFNVGTLNKDIFNISSLDIK